jgi:hypothetical protein
VPGVEVEEGWHVRLLPLPSPWSGAVHAIDALVWGLLVAGLFIQEVRLPSALGLVLWLVPAAGNLLSLYDLRYHQPMAGLALAAVAGVVRPLLGRVNARVKLQQVRPAWVQPASHR